MHCFLQRLSSTKKNLCTQIRRYLKLEKNRFAGAFLDAVIATHISFQSGKKTWLDGVIQSSIGYGFVFQISLDFRIF